MTSLGILSKYKSTGVTRFLERIEKNISVVDAYNKKNSIISIIQNK
jgi:hypothetical protein